MCRVRDEMEKYENIAVVGEGSYGLVMKCRHRETGQMVAIKKFIETEEDQAVRKMALREIRMLKKLRHENLVNMIEVFRRKRRFYLVFEYMDHTVLDELEENTSGLGNETSREYIFQVLRGIDFCHNNHIVHRDVKPENVLVSQLGVIKLCDFGFARLLASPGETYTDYVATRWYRAPELLVGDTKYGKEVDVWAVGCLFAEMMSGDPLFPGDSDIDQLYQITKLLGKLSHRHQQLVARNPMLKGLKKGAEDGMRSLYKMYPNWPNLALEMLSQCLKLDPAQRPTSAELLRNHFFIHDHFSERFLPTLRAKIQEEFHGNPLLQKYQSSTNVNSAVRKTRERGPSDVGVNTSHQQQRRSVIEPRWKISLSNENNTTSGSGDISRPNMSVSSRRKFSDSNANNAMDATEDGSDTRTSKLSSQPKFSIPSVQLNKVQLSVQDISPPSAVDNTSSNSPTPFQSLENTGEHFSHYNMQVLHPSINNLSFSGFRDADSRSGLPTKFSDTMKRSPLAQGGGKLNSQNKVQLPPRTQFLKRLDRNMLLDVGQLEKTGINSIVMSSDSPTSDKWYSNGRKQGIVRACETWKTPKTYSTDFSLPNVPGASGSPSKGMKKKLNPMPSHASQTNDAFISPENNSKQKLVSVSRPKKRKLPSLDFLSR